MFCTKCPKFERVKIFLAEQMKRDIQVSPQNPHNAGFYMRTGRLQPNQKFSEKTQDEKVIIFGFSNKSKLYMDDIKWHIPGSPHPLNNPGFQKSTRWPTTKQKFFEKQLRKRRQEKRFRNSYYESKSSFGK